MTDAEIAAGQSLPEEHEPLLEFHDPQTGYAVYQLPTGGRVHTLHEPGPPPPHARRVTGRALPEVSEVPVDFAPPPEAPPVPAGLDVPADWLAQPPAPPGVPADVARFARMTGGGGAPTSVAPASPAVLAEASAAAAAPRTARAVPASRGLALPEPATDEQISELANLGDTPDAYDEQPYDDQAADAAPRRAPDLVDRQMRIEQQQAFDHGSAATQQLDAERAAEQQRQEDEADRRQAAEGAQRAYQGAIDRVAATRIDPHRWWRDQGAAGSVAATIAVSLGALGQAITGGDRNFALEQINAAVDRDIAAQETDVDSGRAAADLTGNMLDITQQEFASRDAAREAARAGMLRQAAAQLAQHSAELGDDQARLTADQTRAGLIQQAAEAEEHAMVLDSQLRYRDAQTQREYARAQREQILAARDAQRMMGGGRPEHPPTVTDAQMNAYDHQISSGIPHDQAAANVWGADAATLFPDGPPVHEEIAGAERGEIESAFGALDAVEGLLPPPGADIPGYGIFDSQLGDRAVGQSGRDLRRAVTALQTSLGHYFSGAALTESERADVQRLVGSLPGGTEDDLRHGLDLVRGLLTTRLHRQGEQQSRGAMLAADDAEFGGEPVE